MKKYDQVGIVILNYNNWKETIDCIESVLKSDYPAIQIVVVDNASTDNSCMLLQEHFNLDRAKFRNTICISSGKNGGYAYGNNVGLKYCLDQGMQYAIITNSDVLFEVSTISHMIESLLQNKECVIVAPRILDSSGIATSIPRIRHHSFFQYLGLSATKDITLSESNWEQKQKIYSMSGCCFALNISLFKQMGALDEGTFLYGEEAIMAMQAQNAGYEIWYEPKATVTHNHKQSKSLSSDFALIKSCLYYWKKYENGKRYQLALLKNIFLSKIILKSILGRYGDQDNFRSLYMDLSDYYRSIMKTEF